MNKMRRRYFIILFISLLIPSGVLIKELIYMNNEHSYNFTIITKDKIDESMITFKEGAEQAAKEMHVNLRVICLSEKNNVKEQKELIQRESENYNDALLIMPVADEEISNIIEQTKEQVPVILLKDMIKTKDNFNSVNCDDSDLGVKLGKQILDSNEKKSKIVVIKNNLKDSSYKNRYEGLISFLEKNGANYIIKEFREDKISSYYEQAEILLKSNLGNNIIVVLDTETLEDIAQTKKKLITDENNIRNIKIYGYGSTSEIISLLEENTIDAIALQNEFNIGYLGVKNAVNYISNNKSEKNIISSQIITTQNMYTAENQRQLFLFVR